MGNYTFSVRARRWAKFFINSLLEKTRGLDFSMVYVGELQKSIDEYHGYSMTDAGDMKRMLQVVPVDPKKSAFLDIGCGKGMCLKCAAELGYKTIAGLDLDEHLLEIAKKNMSKLKIDAECLYANAAEFEHYADFDVFYFYNPFGRQVFEQVIEKIKASQSARSRDIWVVYYHPVSGDLFEKAGFRLWREIRDTTRDTTTKIFALSSCDAGM